MQTAIAMLCFFPSVVVVIVAAGAILARRHGRRLSNK